jgi:hypothetical protein
VDSSTAIGIVVRECVKPLMYGYLRVTELADDEVP